MGEVTLRNFIDRHKYYTKKLEEYPDKKELFERKIREAEASIVKVVLNNPECSVFERLY